MTDESVREDAIMGLAIAILADHAYLPAGAAEQIAVTVLAHLKCAQPETDSRVMAAAKWLRADDTAYEQQSDALRAARAMLQAADAVDPLRMHVPSLHEQEWTTAEIAAADEFMRVMGDDLSIFAKGPGCGRMMRCIRAALMAATRL